MSNNCVNYNCADLPDYASNDCNDKLQGGISAIIVLECDHTITDPSNASEVSSNLTSGKARLVEPIQVGVDAASPVEVPSGVAGEEDVVATYERSLSIVDPNINDTSIDFWNEVLTGRALGGVILYEREEGTVTWIDSAVSFKGSRIIPNVVTDIQRFEATMTWKSLTEGLRYTAPAGIFST